MTSRQAQILVFRILQGVISLAAIGLALILPKRRQLLVWGPVPIISNKYWSAAMRQAGRASQTLVDGYYGSINTRTDFDLMFDDLVPRWVGPSLARRLLAPAAATFHTIRNASVVHTPFSGGPMGNLPLVWRLESHVYRLAGIRTVIVPYGADAYMYSRIIDPLLRNALLLSYPAAARSESAITRRVNYWTRRADVILCGPMIDGLARWDVITPQAVCIDVLEWTSKPVYSAHNGSDGVVRVLHTPNHRGFKGTEFLIRTVEQLRAEGLQVELLLLEGVPNDQVRRAMQEADILAEQFIATAYALSGIEGMASGLPVLANLEHEAYTRLYRRYAFLDECPILSTTPETLEHNLRILVTRPSLREELGRAGRSYVEKYHSFETAQHLFGAIYDAFGGQDVDLMNLFHPLKSVYNHRRPRVQHPLLDSRLGCACVEERPT